jgi:formate dehydrogenase major subunit
VPTHREPIYTSRPDLVAKYPTRADERQFRLPNIGFLGPERDGGEEYRQDFPSSSPRAARGIRGGGEETRSNRWLAELQQDMFVEINTADAADRGIKDGQWVWVMGAENGAKSRVKALVPDRVGRGVAFIALPFRGLVRRRRQSRELSEGHRPDRARRERKLVTTYGFDPREPTCKKQGYACQIQAA